MLGFLNVPILRRVAFHARRIGSQVDRHFFTTLLTAVLGFVAVATLLVALFEDKFTVAGIGATLYWAVTTVIGSGDPSYVTSAGGFIVAWLLAFFGVALVAAMTGAVVGFVIDFLLKEGQGMGAAGFRDHIVVCGWNSTARDLIEELKTDEYTTKVVVLHDSERNPAGDGVYFVRGDITAEADLRRAGIPEACQRHRLSCGGDQRGGHALDPVRDGDRVDRAGRPDRGGGQQPRPRGALPPGQGR